MSEIDTLRASLSPEENAFFESGGNSAIPDTGSDNAGGEGGVTTNDGTASGGDKGADAGKAGEKAPSTVPLAALHEERSRRRDLDKTLRETQTQLAELRGKFSIVEKLGVVPG